jgi:hypothetical protein
MIVATEQVEANGAMLACVKVSCLYLCQDTD